MDNSEQTNQRQRLQLRSLDELANQVASAEEHVGGGSAAAASASLAAATAELVVALTARRRANRESSQMIREDVDRLRALRHELTEAGDKDEAALDRLMHSYKTRQGSRSELLLEAAATTLAIAAKAAEVIDIAARQVPLASRFTASDLGAAASIARGSATAALLTAQINIELLDKSGGVADQTVRELREKVAEIDQASDASYQTALEGTYQQIGSPGQGTA